MTFDPNHPAAPEPFTPVTPEPAPVPTVPVVAPAPVLATAPSLPVARKSSSGGRLLNIVLAVAVAVAVGGVAFAVGRGTAPASAANANGRGLAGANGFPGGSFAPRASGQPGFGGGRGGGLTLSGTVESVDGSTLTIKTANGQTVQVTTGPSTTYHTETPATSSDVQTGKTVQVQLDFGGNGRPSASATPGGPVGTANSVTVVP
jgi:Domain of unknown function (DUF5666)